MAGLFDRRKKRKLYEQWVEKSGLPEENVPAEFREGDTEDDESLSESIGMKAGFSPRGVTFYLTPRHLLILGLVLVFLLVLSSSLATILIMQSC